jgi:drug/metabolite transporter (DMT)-like permease
MFRTRATSWGSAPLLVQMLACSCLWAGAILLMKLVAADLSAIALTAIRGIMGGVLIGAWLLLWGQSIIPRGREWRDWITLGFVQGIVPNTLTAYALTHITAGLTAMIQASAPLLVAALAHCVFADERLTRRGAGGVLVGFAGMVVLLGPAALTDSSGSQFGVLAMVAAAGSYAFGNLYVRMIPAPQPFRLAFGQQAFCGLPTLAAVLLFGGPSAFAEASGHVLTLALLGVFGTALPIVLYMNVLRLAGPTLGSMNGYLIPIWTIALGAACLGEVPTLQQILAGVLVLAGVAIVSSARRARTPEPEGHCPSPSPRPAVDRQQKPSSVRGLNTTT